VGAVGTLPGNLATLLQNHARDLYREWVDQAWTWRGSRRSSISCRAAQFSSRPRPTSNRSGTRARPLMGLDLDDNIGCRMPLELATASRILSSTGQST
jgi:hypothetical protein